MKRSNLNVLRDSREKARLLLGVGRLVYGDHYTVLDACKEIGIHHSQYYRWKKLAEAEAKGDVNAWTPTSKRPKRYARKTPGDVRERIVSAARSGNYRSANAIAKAVREELGNSIHTATVIQILESEGLYGTIEVRSEDGRLLRKKRGLKVKTEN